MTYYYKLRRHGRDTVVEDKRTFEEMADAYPETLVGEVYKGSGMLKRSHIPKSLRDLLDAITPDEIHRALLAFYKPKVVEEPTPSEVFATDTAKLTGFLRDMEFNRSRHTAIGGYIAPMYLQRVLNGMGRSSSVSVCGKPRLDDTVVTRLRTCIERMFPQVPSEIMADICAYASKLPMQHYSNYNSTSCELGGFALWTYDTRDPVFRIELTAQDDIRITYYIPEPRSYLISDMGKLAGRDVRAFSWDSISPVPITFPIGDEHHSNSTEVGDIITRCCASEVTPEQVGIYSNPREQSMQDQIAIPTPTVPTMPRLILDPAKYDKQFVKACTKRIMDQVDEWFDDYGTDRPTDSWSFDQWEHVARQYYCASRKYLKAKLKEVMKGLVTFDEDTYYIDKAELGKLNLSIRDYDTGEFRKVFSISITPKGVQIEV